jgi:soluble lytic murein transglycosylase-like protein
MRQTIPLRKALGAALGLFISSQFIDAAPAGVCEQHLVRAAQQENIPLGVLYAVGLTESGRKGKLHPFALNIEGETVFAESEDEALRVFNKARRKGKKLIDLGCMQVNHHYHGKKFKSPREMLEPAKNIAYAAKFLRQLHDEQGSWSMAVARYHASPTNKKAHKRYICSVIRNLVASDFGAWTPESRAFCSVRKKG